MAIVIDGTSGLSYTGDSTGAQSLSVPQSVGIGTTSPGARLEVKGSSSDNATININNNSGNIWKLWNDNGASALNIQYNGSTKVVIDSSGNLMIGRTSVSGLTATNPSGNFQVSDNIANGSYTIGGFGSFLGRQASDGSTVLNTGQANIIFSNGAYGATSTWLSFNSTGVLNSSGRAILKQSGSVIQTLSTTLTTFGTTTSTTYVAVSGLSVTITPSNTSSQVLVRGYLYVTGSAQNGQFVALYRGGSILTGIIGAAGANAIQNGTGGTTRASGGHIPASAAVTYVNIPLYFEYLDSPASTSAQVYQVYIRVGNGSTMYYNYQAQTGTNADFGYYASTITAQEIAA
jgi:hypothetical protein